MKSCNLIESYLLKNDLSTYDLYDIWKGSIGQKVRKIYYKNRYVGIAPAGILTLFDWYLNNRLRIGYEKQEYPITRALAGLTLLNLYKKEPKDIYLEYAKKHIDWLLENRSIGYSGVCWGLNFDWVYSAEETYDKNTPFSTHTPYPLELMVEYYRVTHDDRLLEPIRSVFLFLEKDIKIMRESDEMLILSYGTQKDRIVTNANAYLMYMYALLIEFMPQKESYIREKIDKIYNFLCSVQNADGSWLYSPYESDTFIDCFHSAFVLKNIYKTNKIRDLKNSTDIIERGYSYIIDNFLDQKYYLFKRFSKSNKLSLVKFDLYDNAEMLNIALMLDDTQTVDRLSRSIREHFIDKRGIASVIDSIGKLKNYNHFRWAVVPYLYALSKVEKETICVE